jgi:thiamine-phosphate pyrophosphorylase
LNKYLITSQEFYTDTPAQFSSIVHKQFCKHRPTYALYRDKSNLLYDKQASDFVKTCSEFENIKSFIHQHVDLAKELNATGVHLTSQQFNKIEDAKSKGLEVIVSTHTHEEVLKAEKLGADAVTYSPIFTSPGKGEPKGIDDLKELLDKCSIKVFALGGIVDDSHVKILKDTKVYGFASIRYFYK